MACYCLNRVFKYDINISTKKTAMPRLLRFMLAIALLVPGALCHAAEAPKLSPEALRGDLQFALAAIRRTHPEPDAALGGVRFEQAVAEIDAALDRPLDRDQAWSVLARLNPMLADAHMVLGYRDWRADSTAHLDAGGRFLSF